MWTTVPSILIALILYSVVGLRGNFSAPLDLTIVLEAIKEPLEETTWRDIGGPRVEPTEHELAVTKG